MGAGVPGLVRDPIHLFLNSPDGACPGPKALHDTPLSVPTVYSRACVAPHASQSVTELVVPHRPHPQPVVSNSADGTTIQEGCLGQHSGLIFEAFSLYSSNSNVPVRPVDTTSKTYAKAPASSLTTPGLCYSTRIVFGDQRGWHSWGGGSTTGISE